MWYVAMCVLSVSYRALTQMKGYDAAAHVLACFGGAGGQHACAIATSLGMKTIFVHRWVRGCVCWGGGGCGSKLRTDVGNGSAGWEGGRFSQCNAAS